ncbi:hypothetical protein, partial [Rubrivirga sp.]|uniref:hypothetical protein n=1 Tax=Rubrivirga sp. TaxID=1885344 RepID=UPI003C75011B
ADVDFVTDPGADRLNPRDDAEVFPLGSESAWFEDVDGLSFPLIWDIDPSYVVRDLEDELYIALFDYDPTTGDDPMAETGVFRLNQIAPARASGGIEVLTLTGVDRAGNDTDLSVRLSVIFRD